MVLLSQPDEEAAFTRMENIIYEDSSPIYTKGIVGNYTQTWVFHFIFHQKSLDFTPLSSLLFAKQPTVRTDYTHEQ